MHCPTYVPPQRGNKIYVDFDLESPYGTPVGRPKYFPLFDSSTPAKVNSNPRSASIAVSDLRAPRINPTDTMFDIEGSVYLTTGTSAADTPEWMDLLRICGFERRDLPGRTSFYPTKAQPESASIRTFMGNVLHTSPGCRGTFLLSASAGQIFISRFGISGLYNAPAPMAIPSTTPAVSRQFLKLCGANLRITPDGFPSIRPVLKSISISSGGEIAPRTPARKDGKVSEVYFRGDRSPTFSTIIETNTVDTWFPWYDEKRKFKVQMDIPANGRTVSFSTEDFTAQLNGPPSYSLDRGVQVWNIQFLMGGQQWIRIDHQ